MNPADVAWAKAHSDETLAQRLRLLRDGRRHFSYQEANALLDEAARRLESGGY